MIHIIGDNADELANLQMLLETGILNNNEDTALAIAFKLSSGDTLLVDKHNHIVGSKVTNDERRNNNWNLYLDEDSELFIYDSKKD